MFHLRSLAVAVWLLAGAGACSTGPAWAANAQTGKLHPWVLVAAFWGAALLSVSVHYLRRFLAQAAAWTRRSWHRHAPARARLLGRTRVALARTAGPLMRSVRRLIRRHAALARAGTLVGHGWEAAKRAAEQIAGARRAPGALVGWSRSARKGLRA